MSDGVGLIESDPEVIGGRKKVDLYCIGGST